MDSEIALKIEVIQRIGASLHTEDTSAIYFLHRVFGHQVEEVKDAVAEALVALWHPEFKQALRDVAVFVEERERHSEEMSAPPCASFFLQALGNSETYIWRCVDCALAKIGSPVVPDLLEALMHGEDNVRRGAASALGRIGDPVAIPALVSLLRDRKVWVRDCAVHALTRYGSSVVPAVMEELRDERSRSAAIETLGKIGDASAVPVLLEYMQSPAPKRAGNYGMAFKEIGQEARPHLLEALRDPFLCLPDVEATEKAAALKALEKAHYSLPTAVAFCRDLATNPDTGLRQAAESVLSCLERDTTMPNPQSIRRFLGWKLRR